MALNGRIKFNKKNWGLLVREIVETDGVERMSRVADACNEHIDSDGYKVSVEGDNPLKKNRYRATVITSDGESAFDDQSNERLINNFHLAGGE